jgi:hypothetical protein
VVDFPLVVLAADAGSCIYNAKAASEERQHRSSRQADRQGNLQNRNAQAQGRQGTRTGVGNTTRPQSHT